MTLLKLIDERIRNVNVHGSDADKECYELLLALKTAVEALNIYGDVKNYDSGGLIQVNEEFYAKSALTAIEALVGKGVGK